jgi:Ca2+-transporting ATPase
VALAFTTLIVASLGLILASRSWSRSVLDALRTRNPALWWVVGGSLAFLAVALYIPLMRGVFHFARLHQDDLAVCVLVGLLSFFGCRALDFPRMSREKAGPA